MSWWLLASWVVAAILGAVCFQGVTAARRQRGQIAALITLLEACNERARAHARELERLALEDKLTGLHNRRFMDADLPREFERTRRFGRELTLAILDVDDFKDINDGYSHQTGDRVLAHLGATLRQTCRGMDSVIRYGGDEFVLYFPETSMEDGRTICRRILERVRSQRWQAIEPDLAVTLSIGLASTREADSVPELLEAADSCLRAAKQAGKDQVRADDRLPALTNVA